MTAADEGPKTQAAGAAAVPPAAPPPPGAPVAGSGLRRLVLPAVAILLAGGLLLFTNARWDRWAGGRDWQATDDAYVEADISTLSARVGGNVLAVRVDDYAQVRAGQVLVEIDPADYRVAVAAAEAAVASAEATLANLANQEALQTALVAQANAQLLSARAVALEMSQENARQQSLLQGGVAGTVQKVQQATANLATASASVAQAEAAVTAQQSQLAVLKGQEGVLSAGVAAARATLEAARLKLGYTTVVAPFDGVVGTRRVQAADYVTAGTSLISVVPVPDVYVMANFKETQLTRVLPGQPVEITVDSFPGAVLTGRVERISPASGAVFALLPPDNATGNFTKVVQRIPVRIALDPGQALTERLRAGMSVVARIHVAAPPAAGTPGS